MLAEGGPLGILADDLTGAADAAVAFAGLGPTWVLPKGTRAWPEGLAVGALDGGFRHLRGSAAAVAAADAARALMQAGSRRYYLKLDSTARGLSGPVVRSVLGALGLDVAVVCLANPKAGRTVIGGYALEKGVPVALGAAGADPITPASEAYLPTALGPESAHPVALLEWRTVAKGPAAVAQGIVAAVGRRCRVVVVDAASPADLAAVARGLRLTPYRVLPVGSAGLASALAAELGATPLTGTPGPTQRGPVLVLAGSAHPATQAQVAELSKGGATLLDPEVPGLLVGEAAAVGRAGRAAAAALVAGRVAVFWPAPDEASLTKATSTARAMGLDAHQAGKAIAEGLGEAGLMALGLAQAVGVAATGGDTAAGLAAAGLVGPWRLLGPGPGGSVILEAELAQRPLRLALKPGGFGPPEALWALTEALGARQGPV